MDYLLDRIDIKEISRQSSNNIIHLIDIGEIISIDTYTEKFSTGTGNAIISCDKISKLYSATIISSKTTYVAMITGDSMTPQFKE